MRKYRVEIERGAQRWLSNLRDADLIGRLRSAIDRLGESARPHGVVKLSGHDNRYRLRVGDYRIIYEIQDHALMVRVLVIGDRKDVYR